MFPQTRLPDNQTHPPFLAKEKQPTPGQLAANLNWLQANWKDYQGLWIALNNGELLCVGAEEKDLDITVKSHPNEINILCLLVGRDCY